MQSNEVKRWRFLVENWDEESWYLDAEGGVNGNEQDAEFIGTSRAAEAEGERRCELWEAATGDLAARITRESLGAPNYRLAAKNDIAPPSNPPPKPSNNAE